VVNVLLTGGAGFIGSNLIRWILQRREAWRILNLDLLTYAGSMANLEGVLEHHAHRFVRGDICDRGLVRALVTGRHPDAFGPIELVVNLAAESHVDRSIAADEPFIRTNVLGTQTLLSEARAAGVRRFVQVGTDEVYGELPWKDPGAPEVGSHRDPEGGRKDASDGMDGGGVWRAGADGRTPAPDGFTEEHPLRPASPYAASKAAADLLALSYHETFGPAAAPVAEDPGDGTSGGMDVLVSRCSNNFGPRQHAEKLIPTLIRHALEGRDLPLYGDGLHIRDWLHVDDHCGGLVAVAEQGVPGRVYNFGGAGERTNRQVARAVLAAMGTHCAPRIGTVDDRPGHDRRYAVDFTRAQRELGWAPTASFDEALTGTVAWYETHPNLGRTEG
jgi:dTDP-glucose 4,6-dehydratase